VAPCFRRGDIGDSGFPQQNLFSLRFYRRFATDRHRPALVIARSEATWQSQNVPSGLFQQPNCPYFMPRLYFAGESFLPGFSTKYGIRGKVYAGNRILRDLPQPPDDFIDAWDLTALTENSPWFSASAIVESTR
jgi:hypothetical protein